MKCRLPPGMPVVRRRHTFLPTHRWTPASTGRRRNPLRPHRWLRCRRAVRHTRSHRSDSETPGTPAHRSTRSRPCGFYILPCFGTGWMSTGPRSEAACRQMHLWGDQVNVWISLSIRFCWHKFVFSLFLLKKDIFSICYYLFWLFRSLNRMINRQFVCFLQLKAHCILFLS